MRNVVAGYRLMLCRGLGYILYTRTHARTHAHTEYAWLSGGPLQCKILATPLFLYKRHAIICLNIVLSRNVYIIPIA